MWNMKKRRWKIYPALFLVLAFLLAHVPMPSHAETTEQKIRDNISVDGLSVGGLTEDAARTKLEEREQELAEVEITLTSEYGDVETTLGDLGVYGDVEAALREAVGYGNSGTALKRYREQHSTQAADIGIHRTVSSANVKSVVDGVLAKVFDGSANAQLIKKSETRVSVVPGNASVRLDAEKTGQTIEAAVSDGWNHGSVNVPLTVVESSGEETKELSYITDLLGTYTTEFSLGDKGRNQNIARASELMNGKIVYPGEEVSTYYSIDPVEEYNGYALAGVFVHNEVVQGVGGGVCQMSSTLYNALLWAEIEIVKRDYHGLPVSYVPLSYDATMAGGYLDLIFKNNLEHPIYIEIDCNVEEGYITANIYGHEYRDPKRTIEFENNIVEKIEIPEEIEYTEDPEMAPGTEEVTSNGKVGYKTELWKYVYYDGELQDKILINRSNYSATPKKVKRGPGGDSQTSEVSEETESTEATEATSDTETETETESTEKKTEKKTDKKSETTSEEPDTTTEAPEPEVPDVPEPEGPGGE